MKVGILALQGDFREHRKVLNELGVETSLVRRPDELYQVNGLIIPGGESTTISKLMRKWELFDPIKEEARNGLPIFGTCAGLILLAARLENGPPTLELLDITVERNAYGRQIESFESELEFISGNQEGTENKNFTGVFIRAPQVKRVGPEIDVLARHENLPVLLRQENLLAATFHPELTDNYGIHEYFLEEVASRSSLT